MPQPPTPDPWQVILPADEDLRWSDLCRWGLCRARQLHGRCRHTDPPPTPCPEGWPTAHGSRYRNTCTRTAHYRRPDRCEPRMVGRCETSCP
jgi:hypothetical protein